MAREAGIVYFDSPGAEHTVETLRLAKARAEELGIKKIVVASTTGDTGVRAAEEFKNYEVVVVTHTAGFAAPGAQELTPENKKKIERLGAEIFTGAHAFGGISKNYEVVVVTHTAGFAAPGAQELTPENKKKIERLGAEIFTGAHAFGGIS